MSKRGSVLAGAITKGVVLMEKIAGSFTNAPSATETTHSRLVVNHNSLSLTESQILNLLSIHKQRLYMDNFPAIFPPH
jgi:hypothetical protein